MTQRFLNGLVFALAVGVAGVAGAQEIRLRASGHFPADHTASAGMAIINSELARLTKNGLQIDYFPAEQLGGAYEGVDQVRSGQIDLDLGGPEWFGRLVPELEVLNLPFMATTDQLAYCMIDSDLGDYLVKKTQDKGLVVLGWMSNGIRHMTNNKRPIKTLEDIKGLKIRTPPSEIYLSTFRALGANSTPIDIKELYQALQQGVVDGQENPYGNTAARKFNEVQKYLSNSGHFFSWGWLVMNKRAYDRLKPEFQTALRQATARAVVEQRTMAAQENSAARNTLVQRGMQYDEIPAAEFVRFREAVKPVYEQARKKAGDEAIDVVTKALKRCS
jgi:tripartite ATP-independent transporter DctP family solute receptor